MEEFLVTGRTGNEWQASFRISTADDTPLWVDTRTRMTIRDGNRQQVDGLIVRAAADVTDGKIGELRSRDPRTNLCSRPYFLRLLARVLDDIGDKESVGVIVLQISDFQNVTAAYGVAWQDALQRALAERLTGLVRRTDVVGHINDGVFAVIIGGAAESSTLKQIAVKLISGLTGNHQLSGQYVPIAIHGLVTIARRRGHDAIDLLRRTLEMVNDMKPTPSESVGVCEMDAEHGGSFNAADGAA
jgi:GGDEF domain-containing protein